MIAHPKQALIDELVGNSHGNFSRVKEILAEHPDLLDESAVWGERPIEAASHTAQVEIAEFLLTAGAPMDIFTAAMLGNVARVTQLLAQEPELCRANGVHNIPLLFFPVIGGHTELAEMLLTRGAPVNAGEGGNTPLHGAIVFGQPDLAEWLLKQGANPRALNYEDKSPLQLATERGDERLIALLTEATQ